MSDFKEGDRVFVSGGYDMDPPWLAGGPGYPRLIEESAGVGPPSDWINGSR